MAGGEVKLLGRAMSPFVMRVIIALKLKKVDYELVEVEILGQKSEILLQSNPVYKKIPVLLHHDKPVCESAVIVQYIDEVWSAEPALLPADPMDRALARFWAAYIDDKVPSLIRNLRVASEEETEAVAGQAAEVFLLLEGAFTKCGKGKGFFGGERIGYLDLALGTGLGWIRAMEKKRGIKLLDEEKVPLLAGWAERFLQDGAVKAVMPEIDEYVAYANEIMATKMAAAAAAAAAK